MNLTVVSVYPTLLGTYGDGGNVVALRHRARLHGIEVDVINIEPEMRFRSAELYVLGGGGDGAQTAAANALRADGSLKRAAERVLRCWLCAPGISCSASTSPMRTAPPPRPGHPRYPHRPTAEARCGELAADPKEPLTQTLTGYENHAGATHLGPERLRPGHSSRGHRQW